MLAWLTLLTGLSASLLFGATSATPVQISSVELQDNGNAQDLQATTPTHSVQIILERYSLKEYYWSLYQGPYGVRVNPCSHSSYKPFTLASMSGEFNYRRNDIGNPPNPPAMELGLTDDFNNCNWKTNGGGDVGQLICDGNKVVDCERDASWNDGAINCHGWSVHRAYACNW